MKVELALVSAAIFLFGIVSAGLVSYLSNTASGEVEVSGPVFYLSNESMLGKGGHLILNDGNEIENGVATVYGNNAPEFFSDPWEEQMNFYPHNFKVFLDMDIISGGENVSLNGNHGTVGISISMTDERGNSRGYLCNQLYLNLTEEDFEEGVLCETTTASLSNLRMNDRIKIRISDESEENVYERIYINGLSRIEVVEDE